MHINSRLSKFRHSSHAKYRWRVSALRPSFSFACFVFFGDVFALFFFCSLCKSQGANFVTPLTSRPWIHQREDAVYWKGAWQCRTGGGRRKRGEWTVGLAVLWTVFGFALPQKYCTPMCVSVCVWHVASGSCCCSFGCHFGPSRRVASRCLVLVEIHYAKRTRAATRRVAHATWQTKAAPRDKRNGRSWWQRWQHRQLRLPALQWGRSEGGGGEAWQL